MLEEDAKWTSVSLRIYGDDLPLEAISSRLNLAPYRVGRSGEHLHGNPRYTKYKADLWLWSVTSMHRIPLENQLAMTLDVLEPRLTHLKEVLRETEAKVELFIGFGSGNGQGGASISADLLGRLAKLGLPLEIDLYPPDVDEEGD